MLAVHLENGAITLRHVPIPNRPKDFALIRMSVAGICNTDLELQRGYYGFIGTPGHEFVGEVVDADHRDLIGKRVAGEINLACGDCEWCRSGRTGRHCPRRTVLGIVNHPGAFAEYLTLPERNLHVLPDDLPTERAVFLEPLAAAARILDQVTLAPVERIAVLGDGKLGLLIAQVLNAHGYTVDLFGRHREKMRIAEAGGVRVCDTPRESYAFVVDATGNPDGLREAATMTRPEGVVVMKSTVHGLVSVDTAPLIVNELTMVGSRCGRMEAALAIIGDSRIRTDEMIAARYPLSQAADAFAHAATKGTLKVLLTAE